MLQLSETKLLKNQSRFEQKLFSVIDCHGHLKIGRVKHDRDATNDVIQPVGRRCKQEKDQRLS